MQSKVQILRRSIQLGVMAFILLSILAVSLGLNHQQPVAFAQDDPQSPDALCEAALPDVEEPDDRAFSAGPDQVLEEGVNYYAILCTGQGAVYIDLFEQYTPITVNSFVFLAQAGYYNNTTFHRVIADFMVQGGDHTGTGTGGPGYRFDDEILPFLAFSNPGLLAMANSGPGTNGSQFFVTRVPTEWLNGNHTIFGRVLEGQSVVDNMTDRDPATASEPGVALHTVLVITDPSTVDSTFTPSIPIAEDTLSTINNAGSDIFSQGPEANQTVENNFESVDDVVTQFDDDAQDVATELYGAYDFNYEVGGFWEVAECPAEPNILGLGFSMIDLENAENAAAFVDDENLVALQQAQGYTDLEDENGYLAATGFPGEVVYTKTEEGQCDTLNNYTRYFWNRGRYVMILDVVITDGAVATEDLPGVAANVASIFSSYVGEIIIAGE